MSSYIGEFNTVLALGTIAVQVFLVGVVLLHLIPQTPVSKIILDSLSAYAIPIGFFLALSTTALTLIYSDIFGFIPCGLCWFQRIFLYPQVILLGIAWWKKDQKVFRYILALSVAGTAVALYHHYLQVGGTDILPCPASGNGDCGKRLIYEFNYVTFPLMAATAFLFQAALSFVSLRRQQ